MTDIRTTVLPVVIDALIAQARLLLPAPGWRVYDGYPVASDPTDFLAVGADDPLSTSQADSADVSLEWANANGRNVDEAGEVRSALMVSAGSGDMAAARGRALGALGLLDGWLRSEPYPFGLPAIRSARIASYRLYQDQSPDGALVLLTFTVAYTARI